MMMTMMIVFRGLITVTVKISSFFVGENGWQCSRPVWRPSTDFVLPSVWPLVYKHAVNYTSVRRNDLTPLLRFVVDLLCNLFIQLVQHLTRFRLTSRPAVHLCTNVRQKKNIGFFYFRFNDLHQRQIGHKFVCYFLHCSTLQLANFACLFLCETYVFQTNNFCWQFPSTTLLV